MVRFGRKLRFESNVDAETLDLQVPSMMLQPLVENSIKHGLAQKGGRRHSTDRKPSLDGTLRLTVEDDGVGIPESRMA